MDEEKGVVTNELRLAPLRREDLHTILPCQATNNNLSVPVSTSVKLDMHCEFIEMKLLSKSMGETGKRAKFLGKFCIYTN